MKNTNLRVLAMVWAAVMIAVLSSTATLLISGRATRVGESDRLRVSPEEYDAIQRYHRLEEVRQTLMGSYYQDLEEDKLILGAIRGMTDSVGDPYTFYYTPEEMKRNNENQAGMYRGIGTLLQSTADGQIEIIRVFPDSPAEAAGLREGDIILAVDDIKVSGVNGRTYNEAVSLIRGEDGTRFVLSIFRDGSSLSIPVERGDVSISYANWRVLDGDIGYIALDQFTGNASEGFHQAIAEFREAGVSGLVIDLRNNPGGLLDQVVSIADAILPKGLIVYVEEKDGTRQDYYSDEEYFDVPLAVLVNEQSASASEVLAGAVQAFGRGPLVGMKTYGKGIVQSLHTFPEDKAGIQLTTASYYDALDRCPQGVGIQPDVEIALTGDGVPREPDPESDDQLAEAIARIRAQCEARSAA